MPALPHLLPTYLPEPTDSGVRLAFVVTVLTFIPHNVTGYPVCGTFRNVITVVVVLLCCPTAFVGTDLHDALPGLRGLPLLRTLPFTLHTIPGELVRFVTYVHLPHVYVLLQRYTLPHAPGGCTLPVLLHYGLLCPRVGCPDYNTLYVDY